MVFLIQTIDKQIPSVEIFNLINLLSNRLNKILYKYILIDSLNEYNINTNNIDEIIPVGDLFFMRDFFSLYKKIKNINTSNPILKPIEIPPYLQKEYFLGRYYTIVPGKDLDLNMYSFIKDASILKNFSFIGIPKEISSNINKDTKYVQSEVLDILSEYRIFVFNNEIKAIQNYDGNCTKFPDIEKINYAKNLIYINSKIPAYTLDVAITENGTFLLECHNFISCGTYGFYSNDLINMYIEAVRYEESLLLKKINTKK